MLRNVPQVIYDVSLDWGNDLVLSSTGDLQTVSGAARSEQRVLRRLLTVPGNYIWHPEYGAGVPALIGQALSLDLFDQIKALIKANIFLEESVAQTPPPDIFLQTIQSGLFCQINYIDNPTKESIVLTFNTSG